MGEVLYVDFRTKDRCYTKGGGIDDMVGLTEQDVWLNTAPCEMPPVQPMYVAEDDPA